MTHSKPERVTENARLRQQLIVLQRTVQRPKFTASDRWLMVLLARQVRYWKQALLMVQVRYTPALQGAFSMGVAAQEPR